MTNDTFAHTFSTFQSFHICLIDVGSVSLEQFTSFDSLHQQIHAQSKEQRRLKKLVKHHQRKRGRRQSQCASSLSGAESDVETSFIKVVIVCAM